MRDDQPCDHRDDQVHRLWRGPPGEAGEEPERCDIGYPWPRRGVANPQRDEQNTQTEHQGHPVEASLLRGPPQERRWVDEVQESRRNGRGRADRAPAHSPDQGSGDRRQQRGDDLERDRRGTEQREGHRYERRFEHPTVVLAPEEQWVLPVENRAGHEPHDRLVGVGPAGRRREDPHPQCDRREHDRGHQPSRHEPSGRRFHSASRPGYCHARTADPRESPRSATRSRKAVYRVNTAGQQ